MKQFVISFILIIFSGCIFAQPAQTFNYQGIARNSSGTPLANTTIKIRLTIWDAQSGGRIWYREVKSVTTNTFGQYQIVMNDGTGTRSGSFEGTSWGYGKKFLQTEIDPANGNAFINAGTIEMHSVPFAMYSAESGKWRNNEPVIITGSSVSPPLPAHPDGRKLIWHPLKAAFRVGFSSNGTWTDSATGIYSFATGNNTIASGGESLAFGYRSKAQGSRSFAGGNSSEAIATQSFALGELAIAKGFTSVALGANTLTQGYYSFAAGRFTVANTLAGFSIGEFNDDKDDAVYFKDERIFQIGNGTSLTDRRNAVTVLRNGNVGIGNPAKKPQYLLDVGGRMRLQHYGNSTAGLWLNNSVNEPLGFFGVRDNFRMGFYFNSTGNWKFLMNQYGDTWIAGRLTQSSDKRLKKDIQPIDNSLDKLMQLTGYQYRWNTGDRSTSLQTGLIAQEVEKIFPELVGTDDKGMLTVDYSGLIPHLLEAVKSLKSENELLKKEMLQRVNALEKKINRSSNFK